MRLPTADLIYFLRSTYSATLSREILYLLPFQGLENVTDRFSGPGAASVRQPAAGRQRLQHPDCDRQRLGQPDGEHGAAALDAADGRARLRQEYVPVEHRGAADLVHDSGEQTALRRAKEG